MIVGEVMTTPYEEVSNLSEMVENIENLSKITNDGAMLLKAVVNGKLIRLEGNKSSIVPLTNLELVNIVSSFYSPSNLDNNGTLTEDAKKFIFDVRIFDYAYNSLMEIRGPINDVIALVVYLRRYKHAAKA